MENEKMKRPMALGGGTRPLALALAGALTVAGSALAQTTTVTRVVSYEYDAFGQLKKETVQPDDAALRVSTEYTRAAVGGVDFGLVSAKTVTWLDPASGATKTRVVQSTGYDAQGRFALTQTNAKSQTVASTYDGATGAVLSTTDANALTTSWSYDGWGRKTSESRVDGTATTWSYRQCVDSCGWAVSVVVTQQWAGLGGAGQAQTAVPKEDFTDRLGRAVLGRTWGFDGTAVVTETAFTALGYTDSVARPRFQGAAPVWTYYERDEIGRVNKIRSPAPDGSGYAQTTYTYDGRVTSMRNAKGQTRVEERNALGKLKAATDALGYTTSYLYDGYGNLARTQDPLGNVIGIGYDALGRKTSLSDPDVGQVTYWVDPLGQTWKQRDAKGQETTFEFDELGRLVRRLEPDLDSRWEYDTAAKGVGKLAESYTWVNGAKDVRRVTTYDALGRPSMTVASLDWDYVTQTSYDGFGRANVQSYTRRARGAVSGGVSTAIVNAFNAMGYVDKTYRRSDGVDTLVWQGLAIDAEGRDTKQRIGTTALVVHGYNASTGRLESIVSGAASGGAADGTLQNDVYQYDVLGNLSYRAQLNGAGTLLQESFEYDELNRLKTSYIGSQTNSFTYDALGNITSKANVGTYSYPASGYGAIRPHAVSSITGAVAGLTNPGFSYDANGNLVNGLNRTYTWTAADTPLSIDKLSGGQAVQRTEFVYGPDHERVRQVVRTMSGGQPQSSVNTVIYAGAVEKEIDAEKGVTIIRTSLGGDGFVEERIAGTAISADTAGTRNARFFLKDHLGSTIAIVDEAGQLLQRMSYDAWGRRRNIDGSDDSWGSLGTIKNDQDNSGYTGHEQMDQLGLVHMNARLYDPITGRHVSADPTIPDPTDQQAFNRFSYVLNNALAYTDPTGLLPNPIFDDWAGADQKSFYGNCTICTAEGAQPTPQIFETATSRPADFILPTVVIEKSAASYINSPNAIEIPNENGSSAAIKKGFFDLFDGGYTSLARRAYREGSYGWAFTYGASSVLWAGATIASFGTTSLVGQTTNVATQKAATVAVSEVALNRATSNAAKGGGLVFDKAARTWTSQSGLIYGQGSVHGNRIQHVLAHTVPDPSKPLHTVFNVGRARVVGLLDEAWALRTSPLAGDAGAYVIPMGRVVGQGGETSIKIIVRPGTSEVITAFPVR